MKEFFLQFFNLKTLFDLRPSLIDKGDFLYIAGFLGVFLAIAIVTLILAQKNKKDYLLKKSYYNFFAASLTFFCLGLAYDFFAYEGVMIFSARFIFLILVLITVVWFAFNIRFHLIKIPKAKKQRKQKEEYKKYLP